MPSQNDNFVKINIVCDKTNRCVRLQVSLLIPPATTPKILEQLLHLSQDGKFNGHQNSDQSPTQNFTKNIMPETAVLNFPGVEGSMVLRPDGSLILGKIKTDLYLKCSTEANITSTQAIQAGKLMLHGKKISNYQAIECQGDIVLAAEEEFINHHLMSAQNLKIAGKGRFRNLGLVTAQQLLRLDIHTIDNEGSLLGKEKLIFKGCRSITNHLGGELLSSGNIELTPNGNFRNDGQMITPQKILVLGKSVMTSFPKKDISDIPSNTPNVYSTSQKDNATCSICNAGLMQGVRGIFIGDGITHFTNESAGSFIGRKLFLRGEKEFNNSGLLMANKRLCVGSHGKNINAKTGRIYSDQDVEIVGLKDFENFGEISGQLNVAVKTVGKTLNGITGDMQGKKLSLLASILKNESRIATLESLMVAVRFLSNSKTGILTSNDKSNIEAQVALKNYGGILGRQVALQAWTLSNKGKNSKIESSDDLIIRVKKKLDNENIIRADRELKLAAECLNNAINAYIASKTKTNIEARNLNNHGMIKAEINFLKIANRLCNSEKGRLKARHCLEVYAKVIENQGKIESEDKAILDVVRAIVNSFNGHISVEEWLKLESGEIIENSAVIKSKRDLFVKALLEFDNFAGGKATAETINVQTNVFRNHGLLHANRKLEIETKYLLYNLSRGLILAGEKAELFSKRILQNSGGIVANGGLLLRAESLLQNLREGKVISEQDMQLLAGHVLSNAGLLLAKKDLLIKSGAWFTNEITGLIRSNGNLTVGSGYRFDNDGEMRSNQSFSLKALGVIKNNGIMHADKAIVALAQMLTNQGSICSENGVMMDVKLILENCQSGRIQAKEAVQLCSACILRNAGMVQSAKDIMVKSQVLLQNMSGGIMQAGHNLKMFSDFVLTNGGHLLGERIRLEATELLCNWSNGEIIATEQLEGIANVIMNDGGLRSQGNLSLYVRTLLNLSSGEITAKRALEIFAGSVHNQNLMAAEKIKAEIDSMCNEGSIVSTHDLSLRIKDRFQQTATGKLSSEGTMSLLAKDLYLAGQMISKETFSLEAQRTLDYSADTIWICGLLKMMINQGYDFTKPLEVMGSLSIQGSGETLRFNARVGATETLAVNNRQGSVTVEKEGLRAGKQLNIEAGQLKINRDAYVASQGGMKIKSGFIRNDGSIYAKADMLLEALYKLENTGSIIGKSNIHIIAPIIEQFRLDATSDKPVIAANGNCILNGNVGVRDGELVVQGQLATMGGTFQRCQTEEEKAREAQRKAIKKAKKKRKVAILKTVVAMGVAAYFAPMLAPKLLAGLGKLGLVLSSETTKLLVAKITEGMISGAIQSSITGNNILKDTMQSGLFAGFSCGMDQILGNAFKTAPDILRKALVEGGTSGLQILLENGDNISKNMLLGVLGSALGQLTVSAYQKNPAQAGAKLNKLTLSDILKQARDSFVQSAASGALKSAVTKTRFEQTLLSAGMSAVQSFTGAFGQVACLNSHEQNIHTDTQGALKTTHSQNSPKEAKPEIQNLNKSNHPHNHNKTNNINSNKSRISIDKRQELESTLKKAGIHVSVDEYMRDPKKYSKLPTISEESSFPREWTPMFQSYEPESHKARITKDKNGVARYRDIESGEFSISPAERAKQSMNKGPAARIKDPLKIKLNHDSLSSKLVLYGGYYDILKRRKTLNNIDYGVTVYDYLKVERSANVNRNGVHAHFSADLYSGVNLLSAHNKSQYENSRLDINGPSMRLGAGAQINLGKQGNNHASVRADAAILVADIRGNFKSEKHCLSNTCVQFNLKADIALGFGVTVKAGVHDYRRKTGISPYVDVGVFSRIRGMLDLSPEVTPKVCSSTSGEAAVTTPRL